MEKDTKKRTRKPADKTPADNADAGVVDEGSNNQRELAFFSIGAEADRLPALNGLEGNNAIGRLADVAYFSGYFGDRTPAQLAIQILVGQSLELSAAVALFDLELGSGGSVTFKRGQPAQAAGDAIELERETTHNVLETKTGRQDPGGVVVDIARPGFVKARDIYEPPLSEQIDAARAAEAENAIPGPVLESGDETALPGPQAGNGDSSPHSVDEAAELTSPGRQSDGGDLGFPTEPAENDDSAELEPVNPFDSKAEPDATPDPALEASDINPETLAGIEVGATIANWRNTIERYMRELEFAADVRVVKMAKFDAATTTEKKTMFDQAEGLYKTRLSTKRGDVLIALARDGKKSLAQMAGTFAYFEVPDDPETWTFADAIRAFRIIEKETPQLLEDAPKDPAKK